MDLVQTVKTFLKKTARGKVKQARAHWRLCVCLRLQPRSLLASSQVTREHYLRRDIYCGSPLAAPEHRGVCRRLACPRTQLTRRGTPLHQAPTWRRAS